MAGALENLRSVVAEATEHAVQLELENAKGGLEKAGAALQELLEKHATIGKDKDRSLAEIAELAAAAKKHPETVPEGQDIDELVRLAERETLETWERANAQIEEARARLLEARTAYEEASVAANTFDADTLIPGHRIQELIDDIVNTSLKFPGMTKQQIKAHIRVYGGRAKKLQRNNALLEEEARQLRGAFGRLTALVRQYSVTYVDALDADVETDWDAYITSALQDLCLATEEAERMKAAELEKEKAEVEALRKEDAARAAAGLLYEELTAELGKEQPVEQLEESARRIVKEILALGIPASDETLLDLTTPIRSAFDDGSEFRSLRKQFAKGGTGATTIEDLCDDFPLACEALYGAKCIIIGGQPRENRRSAIENLFHMASLEWVECERGQCIRQHERIANAASSYNFIFTIVTLCGHHVESLFRNACKGTSCRFVRLSTGFGSTTIARATESVLGGEVS